MTLTVVCWLWKPRSGFRTQYGPAHVNVLRRMVERHYRRPHWFVCFTDVVDGFERGIQRFPLVDDIPGLPTIGPEGANTYCYRRLWGFSAELAEMLGSQSRYVSLDLDCVICGDLEPLWDRPEELVVWQTDSKLTPINTSMWLHTPGTRREIWDSFIAAPAAAIRAAHCAGYRGTDQAWLNYALHIELSTAARWTRADGVYSYRQHLSGTGTLPSDARIVMFPGHADPTHADTRSAAPWIEQHYR